MPQVDDAERDGARAEHRAEHARRHVGADAPEFAVETECEGEQHQRAHAAHQPHAPPRFAHEQRQQRQRVEFQQAGAQHERVADLPRARRPCQEAGEPHRGREHQQVGVAALEREGRRPRHHRPGRDDGAEQILPPPRHREQGCEEQEVDAEAEHRRPTVGAAENMEAQPERRIILRAPEGIARIARVHVEAALPAFHLRGHEAGVEERRGKRVFVDRTENGEIGGPVAEKENNERAEQQCGECRHEAPRPPGRAILHGFDHRTRFFAPR